MAAGYDEAYAQHWKTVLTAVSLTFAILPTFVFGLRVYTSHMVSHKIRADDILMGCAVILMWGNTASVLMKAFNGVGVPNDLLPEEKRQMLGLGSWLIVKFWASSMMCVKLSIILFLKHILDSKDHMRIILNVTAVLVVCWACVPFFFTIFFCNPVSYYWDKTIEGGWCIENHKYIVESIVAGALSLVSDIAILIIPIPSVWSLKIKLQQKIAITAILCVGGVVCVFSLLRCVQFAYFDTKNLSTSSNLQSLWTILENDFSVLCGCLPQLRPLFRRFLGDTRERPNHYRTAYEQHYNRSKGYGFRLSGVKTMVSAPGHRSTKKSMEGRNSSEVELKGIEVHTTINREVSTRTRSMRLDAALASQASTGPLETV